MADIARNIQKYIDDHLNDDVEIAVRGRTTAHEVLPDGRIKFTVSEVVRGDDGAETGIGDVVGFWFGTPPPTKKEVDAMVAAQEEQSRQEEALAAEERRASLPSVEAETIAIGDPDAVRRRQPKPTPES